jgi:hypothetical protein
MDRGDRPRGIRPRMPGDPPHVFIPPTEEELAQATEYMKEHFPNKYRMFDNLPERGPVRERLTQTMVDRYRRAMFLQSRSSSAGRARRWPPTARRSAVRSTTPR